MEKIMQSPFSFIIGFLSSLILNEFIKKVSTSILADSTIETLAAKIIIVCLGGFWIFYTIYGTISWLMFIEYSPRAAGLPPSYPKMIFLRFLEFLPFICLYDIVNIMGPTEVKLSANKTEIIPGIAEGVKIIYLNRLSIEIGIILILWAIWNLVWWCLPTQQKIYLPQKELDDLKENQPKKTVGLLISGIVFVLYPFINTYSLLHFPLLQPLWQGVLLLSIFTFIYLLCDILFIHKEQYDVLTKVLSSLIMNSPSMNDIETSINKGTEGKSSDLSEISPVGPSSQDSESS